MYVMKSTREALLAQEKTIVTGDCCYLNPLMRRIVRFIGEQPSSPRPPDSALTAFGPQRSADFSQGRPVCVGPSHVAFVCCRCFCLRTVRHRHLCQRGPGGDRRPLALLPVCVQAQLHQQRVPLQPPVHHQRQHLHGEPGGGGERSPLLPVQGRLAQHLLGCLRHGETSRAAPGGDETAWLSSAAAVTPSPCSRSSSSRCTSPAPSGPSPAAWPSPSSAWELCVRPSSPASTGSPSTATTAQTCWLASSWDLLWRCSW